MKRASGILMPISSLPGPWGIGTLGQQAYEFVDFLSRAGQTYWQILPIGPTGYGDSPYQSCSAFAANPYFIDPAQLVEQGLLTVQETQRPWGDDPQRVDYGALYQHRHAMLEQAVQRISPQNQELAAYVQANAHWLEDYALFMALKEENGQQSWQTWPQPVRMRQPQALEQARQRLAHRVHYWQCVQYLFACQWQKLHAYAAAQGISIIGDIPIYVSPDSSDLWAHPELFQTDGEGNLTHVAGCPPDAYAADGQLWGNPLYKWEYHKATGYAWWVQRLRSALAVYDVVRIDHFRGFESYYSIPAGQTTAQNGSWQPGPGMDLMGVLHKELPQARIIAEDLGYLTPQVIQLLQDSGYPGMKVLQFAFDQREAGDYLPHNYQAHSVVYTGTHDNTTTAAWEQEASPEDVRQAREYTHCWPQEPLVDAFIRTAFASVSNTAIVPMQDWLGLGSQARMNVPSRAQGNWQWRMLPGKADEALAQRIGQLTRLYGRSPAGH